MKKIILTFIIFSSLVSCNKKSELEKKQVEEIPVEIEVIRFDKLFFESKPDELQNLKNEFPYFFPSGNDDSVWINKMQNPLWRELYSEVQKKYSNFEPVKEELESLFKNIKFNFPKTKIPKVITLISEMDYTNKVVYTDSLLIISLELYLGKEHKFYEFPNYLKQNFEQNQIIPDVVTNFSYRKIPPVQEEHLLNQMIYFGKQLYLKDALLPHYSDAKKIGYSLEQIKWCEENESYIWRYFIEKQLLYDDDKKLQNRFINPAPFSKFYLEIDNESPGRVGTWIGWQIVRSYMKNNKVSMEEMLNTDAKKLFENSKFKPKK